MKSGSDMRIPVLFGQGAALEGDVWLLEEGFDAPPGYVMRFAAPISGHVIGCFCCAPRGPAVAAFAKLFRDRAIGVAPFFKRVLVKGSPAGEAAVREALADVVTAARFAEGPGVNPV